MSSDAPVKLRVPRQDLQQLDAFQLSVQAAQDWAQGLPVTNARQVARQLQEVLGQLNRIEMRPELRFGLTEALRPSLLVATASLSKRFLKQPLVMPEEPRQLAQLTDNLYSLAATAYTITAIQAMQQRESIREMNPARLVCESIHRAIRCTGLKLLQTFQLYRQVELHGWLDLHQLYALAERQQLAAIPVSDNLGGDGTVSAAYLQALLLGCCKPNQLRQPDLAAIYRGLREWSALLQVSKEKDGESLFLVNLDSDHPPLYSSLYREPPGPRTRYIDTGPLIEQLEQLAAANEKQGVVFDRDTVVSQSLLTQLINSLGKMSMRNFSRKRSSKTLLITVGFSACHYHLSDERDFEQLLHGDEYLPSPADRFPDNPFLTDSPGRDHWQQANPEQDFEQTELAAGESELVHHIQVDDKTRAILQGETDPDLAADRQYPVHRAAIFDASPGGYCLEWTSELPANIKTGDIACVREADDGQWAIAVVRWLSHQDNQRSLAGLELISPGAEPYGARVQSKRGEETEPLRALLLPEIKLVGQPPTLILPRTGFRERQKLTLYRAGEEFFVQLVRQTAVTGSFVQFEFRVIKQLGEVLAEDKTRPRDSGFDSLWTSI
jgi:hypothetical protein